MEYYEILDYLLHHRRRVNHNRVIVHGEHCKFSIGCLTISASPHLVGLSEKA